jgi:cysteinyl-tRNA synthetase
MGLKIFNTLSGEKEDFVPIDPNRVRMYVCGVTVYDSSHVGHARSLLTFDVIYRYLKFSGFDVVFARNFTDVDDKIIKRAQEENATSEGIAARFIEEFRRDAHSLGLCTPTHEPKATEHIPEIIDLISRLEEKGLAYRVDGDVFFEVGRFPRYGKLSRKKTEELEAGARVEIDRRKKSPLDFSLWKSSKPGEPFWESPWGQGRPGWHIECSAMAGKFLGQTFDIHGGGRDLVFPHHENEIAQSEGASERPFARYWIHHGLVSVNQEKMSKSLGNFFTIRDILKSWNATVLRHYFLTSHYRSPVDFSNQGVEEAARAMDRIYETIDRVCTASEVSGEQEAEPQLMAAFRDEMNDDFNTPRALALMFDEVRALNRNLDQGKSAGLYTRALAMKQMCEVMGLLQESPDEFFRKRKELWLAKQGLTRHSVENLIAKRNRARQEKDWQEADRIRNELQDKGILLEDAPGETLWKVK